MPLIPLFLVVGERAAHAYLDPGTGSMILQMVAAGILGAIVAVKMFWKNLFYFFVRKSPTSRADAPGASTSGNPGGEEDVKRDGN